MIRRVCEMSTCGDPIASLRRAASHGALALLALRTLTLASLWRRFDRERDGSRRLRGVGGVPSTPRPHPDDVAAIGHLWRPGPRRARGPRRSSAPDAAIEHPPAVLVRRNPTGRTRR